MKKVKVIIVSALVTIMSGCASLIGTFGMNDDPSESKVYIGTKLDLGAFVVIPACASSGGGHACPVDSPAGYLLLPLILIDLPLSFICDTILLPYTLLRGSDQSPSETESTPEIPIPEENPEGLKLKEAPQDWKPAEGGTLGMYRMERLIYLSSSTVCTAS